MSKYFGITTEKKVYLTNIYDNYAFKNKKAYITKQKALNGDTIYKLFSYETLTAVAKIKKNGKKEITIFGYYSYTTLRHQKEFLRQLDLSEKQIKKLYSNLKSNIII